MAKEKDPANAAVSQSEIDAPETNVSNENEQVDFKLVPIEYASRLRAFGKPVTYENQGGGLKKFGVDTYQTFTCPLPDGTTLRFTSFDEKFIKAVANDDIAEFYYKPGPADEGGSTATDYRTRRQVANALADAQAKRQARFMETVFSVDALEASPAMRERILAGSIDKILNAST